MKKAGAVSHSGLGFRTFQQYQGSTLTVTY